MAENIETKLARIEERVSSDRKATTIYHQHLNDELSEIKLMLKEHFAKDEIRSIQFSHVVTQISEITNKAKENKDDLADYKKKMKYWEVFQEWKHMPFWTFMAVFTLIAKEEIKVLVNSIIDKFTGQ